MMNVNIDELFQMIATKEVTIFKLNQEKAQLQAKVAELEKALQKGKMKKGVKKK